MDIRNTFPMPLNTQDEEKYVNDYLTNQDVFARNKLIEHNLRLVAHISKKYNNYGGGSVDGDDLISIGTIGLVKAVNTYKPDKGTKLATYAARCIENEILMSIRANKKHKDDSYLQDIIGVDKEGNEVRVEDKLSDCGCPVDLQIETREQKNILYEKLKKVLHGAEMTVIALRYGIEKTGEERTQREIGERMGISRSYVSRIEKKAMEKIRKEMDEWKN
ncbi:RNA polymerase sigma factor [Clostridia bacterium]|nr:RNA polymerase sigma factor [Clostridia bacterium]